jgi:hypothetical protein
MSKFNTMMLILKITGTINSIKSIASMSISNTFSNMYPSILIPSDYILDLITDPFIDLSLYSLIKLDIMLLIKYITALSKY